MLFKFLARTEIFDGSDGQRKQRQFSGQSKNQELTIPVKNEMILRNKRMQLYTWYINKQTAILFVIWKNHICYLPDGRSVLGNMFQGLKAEENISLWGANLTVNNFCWRAMVILN